MTGKTRTSLLSLTIIAVIVFSAFGPTIAYADGGTPTEPPPAEATSQPEEASVESSEVSTETAPEATAAPEESAAPEAAPAEAGGDESESSPEASTSEATEEAAPVAEEVVSTPEESAPEAAEEPVLAAVPENTTVTVLDENGQSQPLATQEAADAIATSDPIWCPASVTTPTPGAGGCTGSFNSFDELLTFLSQNPTYTGAGTIYVEQGAYQGNDPGGVVDFDSPSYNLGSIRSSSLTITGGWNPSTGAVDPANTSNFTNTQILIGSSTNPWGGSLTINNISMNFTNPDSTEPAIPVNGLTLHTQGDVALSNVSVTNAPSAGAEIHAGGGVTIENSKFDRNKTAGANIRSGGSVTVVTSSFSNPATARRQKSGLDINAAGAVTLFDVLADENREVGINIVAGDAVTIGTAFFNGTRSMQGTGAEAVFLGYGLQVVTPGSISIDSVEGNRNFLWGASLDAGGAIAIQNSVFNANTTEDIGFIDDTGLFIKGDSIVTLSNVTANDNRLYGAQIDAAGTVSINNSSFSNNRGIVNVNGADEYHGHGLQINSLADILISNTDASNNMLFGGELTAGGQVSIFNSTFNNNSTGSSDNAVGKGLDIMSGGLTDLFDVEVSNNQTAGAEIQSGGFVNLTNVLATNNGADGITLQGACTNLNGGTYSGNAGYGLNLGNSALNLISSPSFANNGAGDIFPENPPTCSFGTFASGASNVFTSMKIAQPLGASSANLSLAEFLQSTGGAFGSIFFGEYAYIDSAAGIQVVALAPSTDSLAMD